MNVLRVTVSISDPWELGEVLKWQPLRGDLLQMVNDEHGGRALIKFDAAINYRGSNWHYVVVIPRHQGKEIAGLKAGERISGAFTGIPDEQAESSMSLDISAWRGGLAFTGEIEPSSRSTSGF